MVHAHRIMRILLDVQFEDFKQEQVQKLTDIVKQFKIEKGYS